MGKGGYGLTYQEVYEMENLTIEAKAIYGMLCSYAGSKAMAYPSVDFICDKLKISRTRFYKHMNLLVGAGVVKKEQRKNENQSFSGNVYVLVPNLQNIQMPCTENEYAGNASTGNEETNINTFNINTLKSEESGKGTGMIKLVVNLDSRTVLERLINTAKEMQMSNGQNVFELGR